MSQGDHEQPGGGDSVPGVREPSLFDSLLPIGLLIGLLSLSFYLFRNDASYGPNQIASLRKR